VFDEPPPSYSLAQADTRGSGIHEIARPCLSYSEERRRALDEFERDYAVRLLAAHEGQITAAAATARIDRTYLYRIMRRHGIRGR
jgi:two-component system, NtrC family, response regulator GlrR